MTPNISTAAPVIYDTPPQITGVSPGDIPALSGQAVTITGTNLGSAGSLSICQGANNCLPWTSSAPWGNTEVDLIVDASNATPGATYTVTLSTSLDSLGNLFASAPGAPADSSSASLEIDPAPTYTVSGTVTINGVPMAGVTINVANSPQFIQTNANGYYSFTVPTGSSVGFGPSLAPYTFPFTPATAYYPYNTKENQTQNFTASPATVYLLHGIGQGSVAMQQLAVSLTGSGGIDLSRFFVDAGFDFSECAANQACTVVSETTNLALAAGAPLACSVSGGGKKLADYINTHNASGNIVLVGYSMGGLIARDLLVNGYTAAYEGVLSSHNVQGLVTLGTPNWGYPYLATDPVLQCPQLSMDMAGSWNTLTAAANPLSSFLSSLDASWVGSSYGNYWLAATGRFCANPIRQLPIPVAPYVLTFPTEGCLEPTPAHSNDGVVCADSAEYSYFSAPGPTGKPTTVFDDPATIYSHTDTLLGFGTYLMMGCVASTSANPELFRPPPLDTLFPKLVMVINNGH